MQPAPTCHSSDASFLGGAALRNHRRDKEALTTSHIDTSDNRVNRTSEDQPPALSHTSQSQSTSVEAPTLRPPPRALGSSRPAASFSTPTDLQNSLAQSAGRYHTGMRFSPQLPPMSATASSEPPKVKKGLPFLKNPVSTLLMRRKTSGQGSDVLPLPVGSHSKNSAYDPRIRGTLVHDFSAPRRRDPVHHGTAASKSTTFNDAPTQEDDVPPRQDAGRRDFGTTTAHPPRRQSNASDSAQSGSFSATSLHLPPSSSVSSHRAWESTGEQGQLGEDSAPPVPPKANDYRPRQAVASRHSSRRDALAPDPIKPVQSLEESLLPAAVGGRETLSTIPKHMKSTSSRFSFDMIGAAKQEKILEERHRQREAEKRPIEPSNRRDSRFDEFEEDSIDYDAMMDDDGLEERIPGVNADVEEDFPLEDLTDPDNDQGNFSGFVFQRSNTASSLASPQSVGMMGTPRDHEDQAIGFSIAKESQRAPSACPSTDDPKAVSSFPVEPGKRASGLGIQGLDMSRPPECHATGPASEDSGTALAPSHSHEQGQDDIYFDDGVLGLEDELAEGLAAEHDADAKPFDESIFDKDDQNLLGRPGLEAFGQAPSASQLAQQGSVKRESDMTSTRLSGQSRASHSTTHTSFSLDSKQVQFAEATDTSQAALPRHDLASSAGKASTAEERHMAAYQAALAAAANAAAASGKFQRSSSPNSDGNEERVACGNTSLAPDHDLYEQDDDVADGHSQSYYDDLNDYELDDDAIIAEANASALANDFEGWYGQEFGFYSAPGNGHHGSYSSCSSNSTDYEYANGGVFEARGLNGLNRSTSGRMISREPNLTPITERSEYSNRNSLMSLIPSFGPGTPSLQSPGLAQLAMMGDRGDDQINLSALLRLRSKAWGGSQASLTSSKDSSPRSDRGDTPATGWKMQNDVGGRQNSVYSSISRESELGSAPDSPTLTSGMPAFSSPLSVPEAEGDEDSGTAFGDGPGLPTAIVAPQPQHTHAGIFPRASAGVEISSVDWAKSQENAWASMGHGRRSGGHRHRGSADSISYMMEEECGETRWIMERRRTGETGEVEILEREVVEGGRI